MKLRLRLLLVLVAVNAVVLGALALWVQGDESQQAAERDRRRLRLEEQVKERFSRRFAAEGVGDVRELLSWPLWSEFEEALVLDNRILELDGEVFPVGAFLNPNGCQDRSPDFPVKEIARAMVEAARTSTPTHVAGGLALPMVAMSPFQAEARIWGGVFVRLPALPSRIPLQLQVLLAAGVATLLGGLAFYFFLGRAVVRPVESLALAAHEFGEGRDPTLPSTGGSRELEELLVSFRAMMGRIRGFQGELSRAVDRAENRATRAERRAARGERLAALGTLAAGIAHEINSPLAGATHGVETLRAGARGEKAEKHGALVAEALDRIAGLVKKLLRLAPTQVDEGPCILQEVLRDLPSFLESRTGTHDLILNLPAKPLQVRGSSGDLFPVFLNLVSNALDALDEEGRPGRVELTVEARDGGGAEIRILDDGPGVPPAILARLPEPFLSTKDPGEGTGLGLALAFSTLQQLGGTMEVENRQEGGFQVRMILLPPSE